MNYYAPLAPNSEQRLPLSYCPISAGEALENSDDYELLDVNELITGGNEGFVAYRVTGDSMVEQILPGYLVFVDPFCAPQLGDTIAAYLNGKTCIKILERRTTRLYLVAANKKYSPKEITAKDDFRILGVVKGHLAVYSKK